MDHGLLVSTQDVPEPVAVLVESLGHSTDVSVAEYPEGPRKEWTRDSVSLGRLGLHEPHQCLGRCHAVGDIF